MRVVVLLGGSSEERDVSLASGCQVAEALRQAGHDVVSLDPVGGVLTRADEARILVSGVRALPSAAAEVPESSGTAVLAREELADADVVFPALHGGRGEDGTLQALLDLAGVTYAGSGMLGCALAMDKDVTKRILRDASIPTPAWLVDACADEIVERLGLPLITKPVSGGSSVRLSLLRDRPSVESAVAASLSAASGQSGLPPADPMMYEAFVSGREFTVGIVGGEALPVGEIVSEHELFDYECKYQAGMAQEIFPADIPEELEHILKARALDVHRVLRLRDFSRVDFMVDEAGEAWCLEANALPGLTGNSLLPRAARAAGFSFAELCDRIVRMAAERGVAGSGQVAPRPGEEPGHVARG